MDTSRAAYRRVKKTCQVLFKQSDISYFAYARFHNNKQLSCLCSEMAVPEGYIQEKLLDKTWLPSVDSADEFNRISLWNVSRTFNNDSQNILSSFLAKEFFLTEGIDFIEKQKGHMDLYCFASNSVNIYKTPMSLLQQFIYYFRQECHDLIRDIKEINLLEFENYADTPSRIEVPLFDINSNLGDSLKFDLKRYYLDNDILTTYLTSREVECVNQLALGRSAKEIARLMNNSPRTIENHIQNIKSKLNCNLVTEMLYLLKKHSLIS